jgi:hypothetical protein
VKESSGGVSHIVDKHSDGFSAAAIFSHTILDRLQKMAENIDRVS